MKHNVSLQVAPLIAKTGKDYSQADLSKKMGITRQTVVRLLGNQSNRIDMDTLGKLLDFFHREGLDVGIADLFVVTESETK